MVCHHYGGPENTYQWLRNGLLLENETNSTLNHTIIRADVDGGMYTCIVDNPAGSDNYTVNVWTRPVIEIPPMDAVSTVGGSVTFTCRARGYPTPTYEWTKTDGTLPQNSSIVTNTSSYLTIESIKIEDEGEYTCIAVGIIDGSFSQHSANLTGKPRNLVIHSVQISLF